MPAYTEVVADEVIATTAAAILCDFEDVGEVWIPRSQLEKDPDPAVGDREVVLSVEVWLARKHNLDG